MNKKSLWDRCEISCNKDEDSFVGIRVKDGDIRITFPIGYNLVKSDDIVIRKEILSLLGILKKFVNKKDNEESFTLSQQSVLDFPIISYQHLILGYFSSGYYSEKEICYTSANKGEINWKRTIQKKKPFLTDDNAIYLDFIVKKNIINTNAILTRIHEYCVFESFIKLGWLYTDMLPMQPRIKFNKKMFIAVLNEAISQTFNDNKKQLFIAMRNVVNCANEGDTLNKECSYGTLSFEYVWERMIDYVFGESNKEIYFPKARWTLVDKTKSIERSPLRQDTIIRIDDKIYILDAKYYNYGATENPSNLPASSSIQKQITYGEYLTSTKFAKKYEQAFSQDKIYNAFVMPFNKDKKQDDDYKFVGIATGDWKENDNQYENIVGLLLDTKHLINNCYRQNEKELFLLTQKIESIINEIIYSDK